MCTSVKQCWSAAPRSLINVMKNAKSTIAQTLSNGTILNQIKNVDIFFISSPRMKRASLKGLRAKSARAVTGRQCPHSGEGEDFLTGQLNFFTKSVVTLEREVEKSIPRWAK